MTELKRFEQWWDAGDDIPNDGPYTPDTPIQFAWAGWQAALAQRTWVGLTDEEKLHIEIMGGRSDVMLAEMVEAKLKEKNNVVL